MRYSRWLLVCAFVAVPGCEGSDPYVEVFRDQLAAQREVLEILRSVKDEPSMQAASEELLKRKARMDAIKVRAGKLLAPGREVREKLQKELPAMEQTLGEIQAEVRRIMQLPGGEEFLRLGNMKNMGSPP